MDERLGSHISQYFVLIVSAFCQQAGVGKSNATITSSAMVVLSQQCFEKIFARWINDVTTAAIISTAV